MNGFGRLLKYQRLRQGLTQDYVCRGICTVSHLSKIENGKAEAPSDLMRALFKRLNVALYDDVVFIERYKGILQNGFQAFIYNRSLQQSYQALLEVEHQLLFSPLFIDYLLFKQIYVHYNMNKIKCDQEMKLLLQIESNINQTQRGWLYFLLAVSDIPTAAFANKLSIPLDSKHDCFVWAQTLLGSSVILLKHLMHHYYNGDYDAALSMAEEGIRYALKEGNAAAIAMFDLMIGNCYAARSMIEESAPYYQRARQLFSDLNCLEKVAMIDYNLGATYLQNRQYERARIYLETGLARLENLSCQQLYLFSFYEKLALLHGECNNILQARQYLIKAQGVLLVLRDTTSKRGILYERLSLAALRLTTNYRDLAQYRHLLESLCRQLCDNPDISWGYFNFYKRYLYDLYCYKRQYKKALSLTQQTKKPVRFS